MNLENVDHIFGPKIGPGLVLPTQQEKTKDTNQRVKLRQC